VPELFIPDAGAARLWARGVDEILSELAGDLAVRKLK